MLNIFSCIKKLFCSSKSTSKVYVKLLNKYLQEAANALINQFRNGNSEDKKSVASKRKVRQFLLYYKYLLLVALKDACTCFLINSKINVLDLLIEI